MISGIDLSRNSGGYGEGLGGGGGWRGSLSHDRYVLAIVSSTLASVISAKVGASVFSSPVVVAPPSLASPPAAAVLSRSSLAMASSTAASFS